MLTDAVTQVWLEGNKLGNLTEPSNGPGWTSTYQLEILTSTKEL